MTSNGNMTLKERIAKRKSDYLHLRIPHREKIEFYEKCRNMNKIPAEILRELMDMFAREGYQPSLWYENSKAGYVNPMLSPAGINASDHGKPASLKAVV